MQMEPAGDRGILITLPGAPAARLRVAAAAVRKIEHVEACVIGHQSLLVITGGSWGPIREAVAAAEEGKVVAERVHRIDVSFADDYARDLPELLAKIGRGKSHFLDRVARVRLSVRYLGFRAGWAYCDGWPEQWAMPRRPTSRNKVQAGSFAVAGEMAGFYPESSAGGWNILGRTGARLWDPRRDPPNLLAPGDDIEIVPNEERVVIEPLPVVRTNARAIGVVEKVGQMTTIVPPRDWRRADYGQTPGGPFDERAAALANQAVGNRGDAPLLECVMVGPQMRLARRAAWCGSDLRVREYTRYINVGRIMGFRGYLAIQGGVGGSGPLQTGELKAAEPQPERPWALTTTPRDDRFTIHIKPGPHRAPPLPPLWTVSNQLDRVGIRLRPMQAIAESPPADLLSAGVQFGTLQWHPDGSVVAMGPDHPVTGGYLQPATVIGADLWKLGQLAPGERVTLVAV